MQSVIPHLSQGAPMESRKAAAQIDFIWAQIARTERFRGYRPATVAATGLLGLAAAGLQPLLVPAPPFDVDGYVSLWTAVAVVSLALTLLEVGVSYLQSESELERRLTRQALQQFLPCLAAGGIVTLAMANSRPENVALLPGLWAICFGLGIFASIPFVTPAVIWVALYYLGAGAVALGFGQGTFALSPWLMGGTFGVGQLLMAGVLAFAEAKRDVEA
jgi:hypothetical protein